MKDENIEEKDENVVQEQEIQQEEKVDCIIDPKQQELDELNDRYKRVLAEFENFKKRSGAKFAAIACVINPI